MCKHILNAQVSVRAPCCLKWYDCPECHAEAQDHPLQKTLDMTFICKKCKKAFRKDMATFEDSDECWCCTRFSSSSPKADCPHCDNHFVLEAKTPQAMLAVEGEDARVDARMLRDDRMRQAPDVGLPETVRALRLMQHAQKRWAELEAEKLERDLLAELEEES